MEQKYQGDTMQGRKPVPTHLKIVRGNPGKRPINKREPIFSGEFPAPPEWLSERARKIFGGLARRIEEMGYASASHTEALALAAMRQEEVELCTEVLNKGMTYETYSSKGGKIYKTRPEVAIRAEASRHLQSLLSEFGLSPVSATKVVVPGKPKRNAFNQL
jgi:P27 family predicted phage terminase small subunit